jgi:hypothetical protein
MQSNCNSTASSGAASFGANGASADPPSDDEIPVWGVGKNLCDLSNGNGLTLHIKASHDYQCAVDYP